MNARSLLFAVVIGTLGLAGCGAVPAVPGNASAPTGAIVPSTAALSTVAPAATAAPAATMVPAPTAAPTNAPVATTASAPTATSVVTTQLNLTLAGTIGDLPVQMYLQRAGNQLRGQYFYENTRASTGMEQYIYVTGVISPDNRLTLEEYDDNGTALFQAMLHGDTQITGTWTSATKDRTLPLTLSKSQPADAQYDITSTTHQEQDAKVKATYTSIIPQISGNTPASSTFNSLVADMVTKEINRFKTDLTPITDTAQLPPEAQQNTIDITYDVVLANNQLISVLFHEYTYLAGAAHPNNTSFAVNYDLANNRALELAALFTPNSTYLQALSDYSIAKIKMRDPNPFTEGATPTAENYKSWNIEPQGLRITFDPYQVLPYAFGPQVVFVPYSQLKTQINPQGPLAPFVQR